LAQDNQPLASDGSVSPEYAPTMPLFDGVVI
jgi:hypothetical protein